MNKIALCIGLVLACAVTVESYGTDFSQLMGADSGGSGRRNKSWCKHKEPFLLIKASKKYDLKWQVSINSREQSYTIKKDGKDLKIPLKNNDTIEYIKLSGGQEPLKSFRNRQGRLDPITELKITQAHPIRISPCAESERGKQHYTAAKIWLDEKRMYLESEDM